MCKCVHVSACLSRFSLDHNFRGHGSIFLKLGQTFQNIVRNSCPVFGVNRRKQILKSFCSSGAPCPGSFRTVYWESCMPHGCQSTTKCLERINSCCTPALQPLYCRQYTTSADWGSHFAPLYNARAFTHTRRQN